MLRAQEFVFYLYDGLCCPLFYNLITYEHTQNIRNKMVDVLVYEDDTLPDDETEARKT